jgi:hypothetical protein
MSMSSVLNSSAESAPSSSRKRACQLWKKNILDIPLLFALSACILSLCFFFTELSA